MIDENTTQEESPNSFVQTLSAKEAHRLATRPNIDDFADAVVRDELGRYVLLVRPGEKLIVERFATILPNNPWLDTKTYTVQSVDEATGRVHLWDDELQRVALTDYIGGTKAGYRFKLPIKGRKISSKRKRGRPRKVVAAAAVVQPVAVATDGTPVKRGRGRPKGAKNRDRETIVAEKKAKAEVKAAKKRAAAVKAAKKTATKSRAKSKSKG